MVEDEVVVQKILETRLSIYAWNWESGESVIYSYILVPPNLIENDHNFVLFGYKVTIQQHFLKSRLFWKTKTKYQEAGNLRKRYILWGVVESVKLRISNSLKMCSFTWAMPGM